MVVFDSRRNPVKRRGLARTAKAKMVAAKATLAAAVTARADDEDHEHLSSDEWAAERTELDAAMKEVASYDGVLIALFKEWAQDRGVVDAFSFVCAPFEADHQMVQLQR